MSGIERLTTLVDTFGVIDHGERYMNTGRRGWLAGLWASTAQEHDPRVVEVGLLIATIGLIVLLATPLIGDVLSWISSLGR